MRRRGMKRETKLGIVILGLTGLVVASLTAARFLLASKDYDPQTLCRVDVPLAAHTALIVDKSDPLSTEQARALRQVIEGLKENLTQFERFSIFVINAEVPTVASPVFSLCNPGRLANPIYANQRLVQERYNEQFGRPLDEIMERLVAGETARQSPILEVISRVAAMPEFGPSVPGRRLVVYSDMLQNVTGYTHYGPKPDFTMFAVSSYASTVEADLSGAEVTVYYLDRRRDERYQGAAHARFWDSYFRAARAKSVQIKAPPAAPPNAAGSETEINP